jgi:MscS family membrane protein
MESIRQALLNTGQTLGLPPALFSLVFLFLLGVCAHFLIAMFVRRLHHMVAGSEMRWDDVLMTALEAPLRVIVWVFVVYLALDVFPATDNLQAFLFQAVGAAVVLILAWFAQRLIHGVEAEMLVADRGRTGSNDRATITATAKLLRVSLWIMAGLMLMQAVGLSISGLLAFGGIGGIAVGFAAKDLLANFFGGMGIYLDRPFTIGDWIRSPDQEVEGTVEDIGWRVTRIRTFDQRPLYVPNSVFSQISIQNPSRMFNRRIHETIGLRYEDASKMDKVVADVRAMLEQHEDIDLQRTLIVNFVSFGASSLDFFVYTFTKTTDWVAFHAIKQDVMLKILEIVDANGADVAFPTRTLQIESSSAEPTP